MYFKMQYLVNNIFANRKILCETQRNRVDWWLPGGEEGVMETHWSP